MKTYGKANFVTRVSRHFQSRKGWYYVTSNLDTMEYYEDDIYA